jgi:hypothetical protein
VGKIFAPRLTAAESAEPSPRRGKMSCVKCRLMNLSAAMSLMLCAAAAVAARLLRDGGELSVSNHRVVAGLIGAAHHHHFAAPASLKRCRSTAI